MWMQKHLAQIVTIEVSFIRWTHMILSMGLSSSRLILDRIFTLTWELINYNVRVVTICPGEVATSMQEQAIQVTRT